MNIQCNEGLRADIFADRQPLAEIKRVAFSHDARMLIRPRISGPRVSVVFNFHARLLEDGMRPFVI